MFLTLDTLKKHLNIDSDFTEDDEYIIQLGNVAEAITEKHIDTSFEDIVNESGELPSPVLQAMLLMVGTLYANRESVGYSNVSKIPLAYEYLLSLYKRYDKD